MPTSVSDARHQRRKDEGRSDRTRNSNRIRFLLSFELGTAFSYSIYLYIYIRIHIIYVRNSLPHEKSIVWPLQCVSCTSICVCVRVCGWLVVQWLTMVSSIGNGEDGWTDWWSKPKMYRWTIEGWTWTQHARAMQQSISIHSFTDRIRNVPSPIPFRRIVSLALCLSICFHFLTNGYKMSVWCIFSSTQFYKLTTESPDKNI